LDDDGLKTIVSISGLMNLDLSHCAKITDAGVRRIAILSDLDYLNLRGTRTSDAAVEAIAAMPKLRMLTLRETQVTAQGVRRLSSSPSLKTLEADETTVPPSLLREITHQGKSVPRRRAAPQTL